LARNIIKYLKAKERKGERERERELRANLISGSAQKNEKYTTTSSKQQAATTREC